MHQGPWGAYGTGICHYDGNFRSPMLAYKVNALVQKGYIEKIQDENDRREFHLRPTKKFWDYYNVSYSYSKTVELGAESASVRKNWKSLRRW